MSTGISLDAPVAELFKTLSELFDYGQTLTLALKAFWSWRQLATKTVDAYIGTLRELVLRAFPGKVPDPILRSRSKPIAVDGPNRRIVLDIIGPLPTTHRGNRFVLFIINYFSKWCETTPLQNQDAKSVVTAIITYRINRYEAPTKMAFESHLLAQLFSAPDKEDWHHSVPPKRERADPANEQNH
ncbi:unnamed protein product [Dibothriocephalus latus]|uniref:Integrase catalytic domain-containing protein n=1 Tax=Dibothriocephalus latus TaxID=60516 RepID=A0A3P7LEM3_DIBLA|nr:unnamed protein product [Dibothriocephalus latus]